MKEAIVINQGRANPPYFHIIQPVPGIELCVNDEVHCVNPKSRVILKGVVTEHNWTFEWSDVSRGWILGIWGVEPKLLRNVLLLNDPGFRDDWARVILIKETT